MTTFYIHRNLGIVYTDEACDYLNKDNPDSSSFFVVHDGEIIEVTFALLEERP